MDEKALRLEVIRGDRETNASRVDLLARRHVAVLAVGMTTGAGATGAAALGHAAAGPALAVAAASSLLVISQVRALGALDRKLEQGRENARAAVETLIGLEVQEDADEAPEDHA